MVPDHLEASRRHLNAQLQCRLAGVAPRDEQLFPLLLERERDAPLPVPTSSTRWAPRSSSPASTSSSVSGADQRARVHLQLDILKLRRPRM